MDGVNDEWFTQCPETRAPLHYILDGLLQEVDPLLVVDGLDVSDDHEAPIAGLDRTAPADVSSRKD